MRKTFFIILILLGSQTVWALTAKFVTDDLSKLPTKNIWDKITPQTISLLAQPMIVPRPKMVTTHKINVQAVHNGNWIAFRLNWQDSEKSEANILGKFSDAVAMQFPAKDSESPPSIFMGSKEQPVHILHWRAQYQKDKEQGMLDMRDHYPNMSVDIYPLEFANQYSHDRVLQKITEKDREVFSPGKSAGNPQSFTKSKGIDEIFAEGFGSSSVIENSRAEAVGEWKNGQWSVEISRPIELNGGSSLQMGKSTFVAFAVWQGGKGEVGSRKSITLSWEPLLLEAKK